ncbi:hypothetical protein BWQ96_07071 [Gracilariopsis chorda]|uniref:Transposase IS4-like domain-containing protein n=1 Tax=Gracilariopsis chorda TaxID=448386 RepID=A0A2V3IM85_9FLOR|nr:hypothetical protein BWQ96_07071 [Gracilariopsis chorda]|eukprot:PXF43196.1 hypothetical protein BWQ96_07071 [Gracilariopsis chorda]
MLGARKADRDGHSADALADALFRIILAIRIRRRGESQTESVRNLLTALLDGRGDEWLNSCVVTADCGYGKEAFTDILTENGLLSVFVIPDHILECNPFVAKSYFNPHDANLEDSGEVEVTASGGRGQEVLVNQDP